MARILNCHIMIYDASFLILSYIMEYALAINEIIFIKNILMAKMELCNVHKGVAILDGDGKMQ